MTAGLAKDPGARPADGAALVAELRAVAGGAYGPGWEDRGRSGLAAAALLLAALWPAGGPAAAQGSTVHRISLRRRLVHGHVGAVKAAVMAGIVTAVAVGSRSRGCHRGQAHRARDTAIGGAAGRYAAQHGWPVVGVAAVSPSSAWAVGVAGDGGIGRTGSAVFGNRPLTLRWNGTAWTRVPSPNLGTDSQINDVAAASAGSAWAVGWTTYSAASTTTPLILRWNGTAWTRVPSPNLGPDSVLLSVTATSADSAWAAGVHRQPRHAAADPALERHGLDAGAQPEPGNGL